MVDEEKKYAKGDILASKTYAANRDLLSVALEDGQSYSKPEIQAAIKKYRKGAVK